jgi:Uma2 family endonuclease
MPPPSAAASRRDRTGLTLADIEDLVQAGAFSDDDRFELVRGRLVGMSPKGLRHQRVRTLLARKLSRAVADDVMVASEPQFNLADDQYFNPDILLCTLEVPTPELRGPEAFLVVGISDSGLRFDLGEKADDYAAAGVPEYWVIDAWELVTTVFRQPTAKGYRLAARKPPMETLRPLRLPGLGVRLADLPVEAHAKL